MKKIIIFLSILFIATASYAQDTSSALVHQSEEKYKVAEIIDGRTLRLDSGEIVRMIGIKIPESSSKKQRERKEKKLELLSEYVARHLKQFMMGEHDYLKLEFDEQHQDSEERLLAYVYAFECHDAHSQCHKMFMNKELLMTGFAVPEETPPNLKYKDEFRQYHQGAVEAELGFFIEITENRVDRAKKAFPKVIPLENWPAEDIIAKKVRELKEAELLKENKKPSLRVPGGSSMSCDCFGGYSFTTSYKASSNVFLGTATQMDYLKNEIPHVRVLFSVTENFKGNPKEEEIIPIFAFISCTRGFTIDEEYIIFAQPWGDNKYLVAGYCSATKHIIQADHYFKPLREMKQETGPLDEWIDKYQYMDPYMDPLGI